MTHSTKIERIAVFSVSAGSGHVRAAQALQTAAALWYSNIEVVHVDLMELVPKLFRTIYTETYIKMIDQHPALWGYIYDRTDREKIDSSLSRLRRTIETVNTRKLKNVLNDIAPDHVICTHFLPAQLLSRRIRKGKFQKPVWVQVTDFDMHSLWIHKGMSGYFAAHDELAGRMSERGIPAENIHITGIPIMPAFSESFSRTQCSLELGLDPARKTLLLMSGGAGLGDSIKLAERLLNMDGEFQLVAMAGTNEKLLKKLKVLAVRFPGRLLPLGFIDSIERVMAASDLAITKPGGLTSSECLAMGLPMIIVSPIPGQEERNADFLLEHGVALKACDANALAWRVHLLLNEPERLVSMREKARLLGRPDSARKVLDCVLGGRS
ncbi:MAG TPA: glycosyltransferase [Desulfuromonadaceae bacterium]|jgi:processive 1,2-diacylglycerol beta-glucosyltransferase